MRLMSFAAALTLLAAAGCAPETDEMPDDSLPAAADSAGAADPAAASPDAAAPAPESGRQPDPPTAKRPAGRDTTPAQKRGMTRKDSLLLEQELERIRNEPRRVPPYPPAERPPEDAGSPTRQ